MSERMSPRKINYGHYHRSATKQFGDISMSFHGMGDRTADIKCQIWAMFAGDVDNWNSKKVPVAACTVTVSRIVAKAFVRGYSKTKSSVKHRNGDRQDNRAENLEWVDRKSSAVNRRSRMVKASLVDDPRDEKEFESILKAERMLSTFHLSYHDAKHNGEPFIREVTWDGRKQKVLFRIFPSELQSFQRL
ncbi:hypothetical protein BJV82DRAFT_592769 [Fennellomyces sp. T-0311]|nr:hypothetical protein BJV82DRAFT_592769 [Fennellomyces sp. T-0311]